MACFDDRSVPSIGELRARIGASGASLATIWLHYLSFGGDAGPVELEAYLFGALVPTELDAARIAHVVWELETFGS